jgi:hypothetical protein
LFTLVEALGDLAVRGLAVTTLTLPIGARVRSRGATITRLGEISEVARVVWKAWGPP